MTGYEEKQAKSLVQLLVVGYLTEMDRISNWNGKGNGDAIESENGKQNHFQTKQKQHDTSMV